MQTFSSPQTRCSATKHWHTDCTLLKNLLAMSTINKSQYDNVASQYNTAGSLPCGKLESELVRIALGNCAGLRILDLGGGSGTHARQAVDAGAAVVDVFDISSEMLRVGQEAEAKLGRQDCIRWFQADATQSLAEQIEKSSLRPDGYDVVMVNWTFDNATSVSDLRGMWENVSSSLKPGGRFLGLKLEDVRAAYMRHGKYGVQFTEFEDIPGGQKYKVECLTQPSFTFEGYSMESTSSVTDDIFRELGLVDFEVIQPEETETVKSDLEFWDDFLVDPFFVMVTARKL